MLFLWVLNPEYGLLNNFLSWFGIRGPSWLSDPKFTKISLMIMDVALRAEHRHFPFGAEGGAKVILRGGRAGRRGSCQAFL